jgi:hypothetical protein
MWLGYGGKLSSVITRMYRGKENYPLTLPQYVGKTKLSSAVANIRQRYFWHFHILVTAEDNLAMLLGVICETTCLYAQLNIMQ